MAKLSKKQQAFIQEYLIDLNATQAAIRAGYSSHTAHEQGAQLLAKLSIRAEVDKAMAIRSRRTGISQDRVLHEVAKIAFADIKDFVSFYTAKTVVDYDDNGAPIVDYKQVVEVKPSSEVDGTLISEISIAKDGTLKFKLHDKGAALDKLGKHLGMFVDRMEHTGKDGGPIQTQVDLSGLSIDDLRQMEAILSKAKKPD